MQINSYLNYYNIRLVLVFFLLLSSLYPLCANPGLQIRDQHFEAPEDFKYRNSVVKDAVDDLGPTAEEHKREFWQWTEKGEERAAFYTDYHAVYPLPVESFISVFTDHENEDKVFPRMSYTSDLNPNKSIYQPHFQEVKMGFKFLGVGDSYHYIVYRIPEWYSDGSFCVYWSLVHSFDNKYAELYGSWYVKEIERDGKPHTYVRNYVETEMRNPPGMLKTVTHLFGENMVRGFFDAAYSAARENFSHN